MQFKRKKFGFHTSTHIYSSRESFLHAHISLFFVPLPFKYIFTTLIPILQSKLRTVSQPSTLFENETTKKRQKIECEVHPLAS